MAAPWWLLGLLLLPLIRWLHRGGTPPQAIPVAHLGLWPAAPPPAGQGARVPPDPAWRRRALLLALLLLALAGPRWPDTRTRVTLWVDDAPAMLLREAGGTRLEAALARTREMLAAQGDAEVELRTLSNPWRPQPWPGILPAGGGTRNAAAEEATGDAAEASGTLAAAIRRRLRADETETPDSVAAAMPRPPPAALLVPDRAHWLLTAGTRPAHEIWAGDRGPDRVVSVAAPARNVGLVRLAARRAAEDPSRIELLAVLANGGDADEMRGLTIRADGSPPRRIERQLAPSRVATVTIDLPASTARVRASLDPADALPEDDTLELDLAALGPKRIAADAGCAAPLRVALAVHPMLRLGDPAPRPAAAGGQETTPQGPPEAVVDCGGAGHPAGLPTLRLRAQTLPALRRGVPRWSASVPASRRPRLDPATLPLGARLQAGPSDRVLLAFGDEPVIVRRAGEPRLVETSIDFAAARDAGEAVPWLVATMADELFGARLLDRAAVVDRGRDAVRVLPQASVTAAADAPASGPIAAGAARAVSPPVRELGAWLAGATAIVLAWELVLLARRLRTATVANQD